MRYTAALLLLASSTVAIAGEDDSLKVRPLRYFFTVSSSMLFCGSCGTESSLIALPTTVHGIRWRALRVGAGVGYTTFTSTRVMPYFGSLTVNMFGRGRANGVFLELDYGGAHAWVASVASNDYTTREVKAWGFTRLSAGYALDHHGLRIAAQAGIYALTTRTTTYYGQGYNYPWLDFVYVPPQQESVYYKTTRPFLAISIGI